MEEHLSDFEKLALNGNGLDTFMFLDYVFRLDLEMWQYQNLFDFANSYDFFPSGNYQFGPRNEIALQAFVYPKGRVSRKRDTLEHAIQVTMYATQMCAPVVYLSNVTVAIRDDVGTENILHKEEKVKLINKQRNYFCNRKPSNKDDGPTTEEFSFNPLTSHDFEQPHKFPNTYMHGNALNIIIRGNVHMPMLCRKDDIIRLKRASTLTKNMALYEPFFNNELFSDVTIELVDGRKLFAHRIVLSTHSKKCADVLNKPGNETCPEGARIVLKMTDFAADDMEAVVKFMYSFSTTDFQHSALRLLLIADAYKMLLLKELCENEAIRSITTENIVDIFEAAGRATAAKTMIQCRRFVEENLKKMSTYDNYVTVDGRFIDDIVNMLNKMKVKVGFDMPQKFKINPELPEQ